MPDKPINEHFDEHFPGASTPLAAEETADKELLRGFSTSPLTWLAAFLILNLSAPFFNVPNRATALIGVLALTFAYVSIIVLFAVSVARKKFSIPQIVAWGILALALWLALDNWIAPAITRPMIHAARITKTPPAGFNLFLLVALSTLTSAALMCLSICAGNLASRLIRTPNLLGPICVVIALVDIWGVLFGGIVSQLMSKAPRLAAKAMTPGPRIGAATGSKFPISIPDIGVGDYLFLGLLFGALFWLGLNWRGAVKWTIPLVSVALLLITLGLIPALPGLLFIGLGVAIPNRDTFQYTREEKFALLYAGIFVVILTGLLYWGATSLLPDKKRNDFHPFIEHLTS